MSNYVYMFLWGISKQDKMKSLLTLEKDSRYDFRYLQLTTFGNDATPRPSSPLLQNTLSHDSYSIFHP